MTSNNDTHKNFGRMAIRDRFNDLQTLVSKTCPIIVDGGAHHGSMISKFLSLFESPVIHAFEPIPECVDFLLKKFSFNNNIKIYNMALGAYNAGINFNVVNNIVSSSILEPDERLLKYHGNQVAIKQKIASYQVRLDSFSELENIDIDIIKLDLQGYELEALKGMEKILRRIRTMTIEVEFVRLYQNQPLFAEIDIFLRNNNFRLYNLYELWTHQNGQLTSGDAVYLNNNYY